eukprot:TRINITY_DN111222_c0_g1_i1.p1 TRINITY_DN111222_c0_g1~~TRINITY_DN111222_c0_g1_i1.p1  ORF type:complete len:324 (+),score=25.99 TRINITY_DN111222_c0_g1_i1:55-1026(+)
MRLLSLLSLSLLVKCEAAAGHASRDLHHVDTGDSHLGLRAQEAPQHARAFFRREEGGALNTPVPTPSPPAVCDDCPCNDATHVRRFGWQTVVCGNSSCGSCTGSDGADQCCAPRQSCDNYECPKHTLGRKSAGLNQTLYCVAASCGNTEDAEACCTLQARCDTMVCPQRYTNKADEANLDCVSNPCDPTSAVDQETCCERLGACSTFDAGTGGCPDTATVPLSVNENITVSMVMRTNAELLDCQHPVCDPVKDLMVCCEERAHCDTMDCQKFHSGYALKYKAEELWCAGRHCSMADLEKCCYDGTEQTSVDAQEALRQAGEAR